MPCNFRPTKNVSNKKKNYKIIRAMQQEMAS